MCKDYNTFRRAYQAQLRGVLFFRSGRKRTSRLKTKKRALTCQNDCKNASSATQAVTLSFRLPSSPQDSPLFCPACADISPARCRRLRVRHRRFREMSARPCRTRIPVRTHSYIHAARQDAHRGDSLRPVRRGGRSNHHSGRGQLLPRSRVTRCGYGTPSPFFKHLPCKPLRARTEKPSLMRRLSLCNVHMSKR